MSTPERKKLRVLALVHPDLVPPEDAKRDDASPWKMEYDVVKTLRDLDHEVQIVPVGDELGTIRNAVFDFKPHIAFNLVEGFDDVVTFDHNIVSYLELLKVRSLVQKRLLSRRLERMQNDSRSTIVRPAARVARRATHRARVSGGASDVFRWMFGQWTLGRRNRDSRQGAGDADAWS